MTINRRTILAASIGFGAAASIPVAAAREMKLGAAIPMPFGLEPDAGRDQTKELQAAIDAASEKDVPLALPPGRFRVSDLRLRAGTRLIGAARTTVLEFTGGPAFVTADRATGLVLTGLVFDGAFKAHDTARGEGLLTITGARGIAIDDCEIHQGFETGLMLTDCSGRVSTTVIFDILNTGLKTLDAAGLEIRDNTISRCGNNGIQVWRTAEGEDGTAVSGNRVSNIRNAGGGSGEYGNGINVFRAGNVMVANNNVSGCTYSAIRGNAASNIQITANHCTNLGEVAIYAEFGFQGALIANNIIDGAAAGISATNFKEGGRLAVIQANLIRNLQRREHEKEDKRGEGITVEADAAVSGNTIEGAPTAGIQIGWGKYMRDVSVTSNVIRRAGVGIAITSAPEAGTCLVANNLISDAKDGAIRTMSYGAVSGPELAGANRGPGKLVLSGNVAV